MGISQCTLRLQVLTQGIPGKPLTPFIMWITGEMSDGSACRVERSGKKKKTKPARKMLGKSHCAQ